MKLNLNSNSKLPPEFYYRSTIVVARDLLGKVIVRKLGGKILSGIIVETEAYPGKKDPASHSFFKKTKRNEMMFEKGGKAYVYFTYGNHYCFNVVTGKENIGSAVLIRAVEPLEGTEIMMKNRGVNELHNLTSGPGKFTKAFAIDKKLNGINLLGDLLYISNPDNRYLPARSSGGREAKRRNNSRNHKNIFKIIRAPRIGITRNTDKLYRFYIEGNPFVSRHQFRTREQAPLSLIANN